jgi:hypothetical protein
MPAGPFDTDDLPAPSRLGSRPELPDPLETFQDDTVDDPAEWDRRRTELKQLFRHYVYGYAPGAPTVETAVERTDGVLGGAAALTEATIRFPDLPDDAPTMTLALFVPADRDGPVSTVLGLNREGNHATVGDGAVTIPDAAAAFGADERGSRDDYWCVEYILERGYGFATYHCADLDPDRDDFADGIQPYYDAGLPGPPGTEWGTLAAWAWGLKRSVDYLRTDDRVRGDEIAVTGHSRRGKASLLAGATDERIGLVAPHQSGTGGTALSRENGQESVARINRVFPHWFNDLFPAFGEREPRLPVDQHLLVALVAPRPLIDTEGARDYWANPGRALDALRAADPAYDLLGVEGLTGEEPLYSGDEIAEATVGRLLQYRRETGHTLTRGYWEAILDFADVHFEGGG